MDKTDGRGAVDGESISLERFNELYIAPLRERWEKEADEFDRWLMNLYKETPMGDNITLAELDRISTAPTPDEVQADYHKKLAAVHAACFEPEFHPFAKIARLRRDCVVTEKIDGTNAQIWISDDGLQIKAGSRTKWIYPGKQTDNFGFAGWVEANKEELLKLGPGRHYGEYWGPGIQRGYGLAEKRFSLFNVGRWFEGLPTPKVSLVPVLYKGPFDIRAIDECVEDLRRTGSQASPGFMRPEGIVVYHAASGTLFKQTLEKDDKPKGSRESE